MNSAPQKAKLHALFACCIGLSTACANILGLDQELPRSGGQPLPADAATADIDAGLADSAAQDSMGPSFDADCEAIRIVGWPERVAEPNGGSAAWSGREKAVGRPNNDYAESIGTSIVALNATKFLDRNGEPLKVPATAAVVGLELSIRRKSMMGFVRDDSVELLGVTSSNNLALRVAWPSGGQDSNGETQAKYGGPRETWGALLSPEVVNREEFGVRLLPKAIGVDVAFVESFELSVYFCPSATSN
jgi:hypothetical protein